MQRFTPGTQVRTETMQDVGNGPNPFGGSDEPETAEQPLYTMTARPIPRPPRPTRNRLAR